MSETSKVYYWKVWNQQVGENVTAPRPGTIDAIRAAQGTPIMDTEFEIEKADLDGGQCLSFKLRQCPTVMVFAARTCHHSHHLTNYGRVAPRSFPSVPAFRQLLVGFRR